MIIIIACEMSARMVAMNSASDNASKMIQDIIAILAMDELSEDDKKEDLS